MEYKKTYVPKKGYTCLSKIGESSLQLIEFGIVELWEGDRLIFDTQDKETAFIILSGQASFRFDDQYWPDVGGRRSVFEGRAHSVYLPRGKQVEISARMHFKAAVCGAPIEEDTQPQLVLPEQTRRVKLGTQPWERVTDFIIDEHTNARRLTIGEAYITPGNWAGFPPHKHDQDRMPEESIYQEIYYYLFRPQQGFALQYLYTKDGSLDKCYAVRQDELVEFPYGYHTTVGAPGYHTYFLWASAGDHQGFFRANDPDHDWVSALE